MSVTTYRWMNTWTGGTASETDKEETQVTWFDRRVIPDTSPSDWESLIVNSGMEWMTRESLEAEWKHCRTWRLVEWCSILTDGSVTPGVGVNSCTPSKRIRPASRALIPVRKQSPWALVSPPSPLSRTLSPTPASESSPTARPSSQHSPEDRLVNLTQFAPQSGSTFLPSVKFSSIYVQWIPAHAGIPGNTLVDLKAKQGSTLPQTSVPIDLSTAKVLIWRTGQ